jgi:hypothetical protein
MQVLVVVNLIAFLLTMLLLFLVVTPHDSSRGGNRKSGSNPRSDFHRRTPFVKR